MKLLDRAGQVTADRWLALDDAALWPQAGAVIFSLQRLLAEPPPPGPELGVALAAGAELDRVLPWLGRVCLVAVPFPVFRDGRGFTAARALRERHGFTGEIRATGHLLPDQYVALLRVGVTTVELPDDADLQPWTDALRIGEAATVTHALPWLRRAALPFQVA